MNVKKIYLFLSAVCIVMVSSLNAQSKGNKRVNDHYGNWTLGAGINVVDDSGMKGKDFFNTKENWNMSNPYLVSVEYILIINGVF